MSALDLDRRLLVLARTRGHAHGIERVASAFSRTGEHAACWIALGLGGATLAHDDDRRAMWLRGLRVVAGAYAVNYGVKLAVRRRRPELPGLEPLTPTVSRLSFPSAHSTASFAAARAYSRVAPTPLLYATAIAFGLTRPYLGVHYPSDVLAGAAIGTAVAEVWPG